ncbi:MAG: DUF861 domain-containing protein [Clostridia bacterium]|nr:DUF861 domain-containing protein [Clostridia bacterium]
MQVDKELIEKIVRQILDEEKSSGKILKFNASTVHFSPADRLDTLNPADKVYTKDLMTLEQSPNLGFGLMEMTKSTFPWELNYDEIDIVLEGKLTIICDGESKTAEKGEAIFIKKGSKIEFSVENYAKFYYITYPANWQNTTP